jgi:hypothetical protein
MILNRRFFLISLLPLLAYGLIEWLTAGLANVHVSGLKPAFEADASYHENAARNWVFSTGAIFALLVAATVAFCLYEVWAGFLRDGTGARETRVRQAFGAYAFIAALVAATFGGAWLFGTLTGEHARVFRTFGQDLFVAVLNSCHEQFQQPQDCTFGTYQPGRPPAGFAHVLTGNIILSSLGLAFASVGCCLSLCQTDTTLKTRTRDAIFRLPQLFLRLSSAMFTAAILSVYAWTNWPIGFLSEGDAATYKTMQSSLVIFYAISMSIIILAFYAPCVFLLNERLARLRGEAEGVKSDSDAPATTAQLVERVLTFLSPLLTAIISAFAAGFLSFG